MEFGVLVITTIAVIFELIGRPDLKARSYYGSRVTLVRHGIENYPVVNNCS